MEKNIESQNQTKIQLSLAALMFFSPLVQNIIKKNTINIHENNINFIQGYIKLGYINIIFLIIIFIIGIIKYRIDLPILNGIFTLSTILLTFLLVIGTIAILTNINILNNKKELISFYHESINVEKKEVLTNYLPVYNIYKWYSQHEFDNPNILLKESIIIRIIFCIASAINNPLGVNTILILIIIRISTLMGGKDIISPKIKEYLNNAFYKNPEELRGYIKGSISFLFKFFICYIQKKEILGKNFFKNEIQETKKKFGLLYNIELQNSFSIKIQYILGIILGIIILEQINRDIGIGKWEKLLTLIFILGRYGIMFFKRNHLPPLPLCKEITDLGIYIYEKIKKNIIHNQ